MAVLLKENEERPQIEPEEIVEEDYDSAPWPFVYTYDEEGYLISDGQPMAEHDIHRKQISNSIEALETYFSGRVAYVSGNNFIHYKEGSRSRRISPDCYVVFDVPQAIRANYKPWEHGGKLPAIIFEFTSTGTKDEDEGKKFRLYEQTLKVPEYILFDPRGDYLNPRLKGYRLNAAGRYEALALDAKGRMYSEQLCLYLEAVGLNLRFFDAKTGEYLRTLAESEQQREKEKTRADSAEIEIALLRAQLEALRNRNNGGQK